MPPRRDSDQVVARAPGTLYNRGMSIPQLAGRYLAFCANPYAAWRVVSPRTRAAMIAGYFVAGFVSMFAALSLG